MTSYPKLRFYTTFGLKLFPLKFEIWHNPRCTKSRQALQLLNDNGIVPEIKLYLKDPPTKQELKKIIDKLGIQPYELVRQGEQTFKDNFKNQIISDDEWMSIMLEHPVLIERPIVSTEKKAIIGRPPESILELI